MIKSKATETTRGAYQAHMIRPRNLSLAIILAAGLVACGGGGGGSNTVPSVGPTNGPTSTPTSGPTTNPNPTPSTAVVTGTVVDFDNNTPVSGASVGLAPWTVGATPAPEATTNASGQFSFTAKTGKYLLVVNGTNTATLNQPLTVAAPTTQATGEPEQNLSSETGFTPNAAQTSGSLRLINLSGTAATKYNVSACVTAFNQGRTASSLHTVAIDEYLTEDAIANVQQQFANNVGNGTTSNSLRSGVAPYGSFSASSDTSTSSGEACSQWSDAYDFNQSQAGAQIYGWATNSTYVWYGIGFDSAAADLVPEGGANGGYGTQIWEADPR